MLYYSCARYYPWGSWVHQGILKLPILLFFFNFQQICNYFTIKSSFLKNGQKCSQWLQKQYRWKGSSEPRELHLGHQSRSADCPEQGEEDTCLEGSPRYCNYFHFLNEYLKEFLPMYQPRWGILPFPPKVIILLLLFNESNWYVNQ